MITIDGIDLEDKYSWIAERGENESKGKVAKGVIFLVSIQNAEKQWGAWQKMIKALDPQPEKVIFCENDSSDSTRKLINDWDFPHELMSFNSEIKKGDRDIYAVIAKNRQLLLNRARQIDPQFAIFIDDDVFPDDINMIEKLIKHNLPILGGAYLRPFDDKGIHVASKWSIDRVDEMPQTYNLLSLVDEVKQKGFQYIIFSSCDRLLYKVAMTSAGCLCLARKAVQDTRLNFFPIRHDLGSSEGCSEDFGYCLLAGSLGYEIFLDGDTRLAHLVNPDKKRPWINIKRERSNTWPEQ
jgi:hypothetical protein